MPTNLGDTFKKLFEFLEYGISIYIYIYISEEHELAICEFSIKEFKFEFMVYVQLENRTMHLPCASQLKQFKQTMELTNVRTFS